MKLKSLVIADHNAAVNEKSGFAHTAHHAREILTARSLRSLYRSWGCKNLLKFKVLSTAPQIKVVMVTWVKLTQGTPRGTWGLIIRLIFYKFT